MSLGLFLRRNYCCKELKNVLQSSFGRQNFQQSRQFRTKKRLAEGLKPNIPPDGGGVGGLGGRSLLSSLTGPLVFTVGFSGVAISAAAVWQYENMRTRLWRRAKDGYGEDLTAAVRAWLPSGWGEHPDTERKRRKAGGWRSSQPTWQCS